MLYTRKATQADLAGIMNVIEAGINYLKLQGSPQWQDGQGPTEALIKSDIDQGFGCVLVLDNQVVGYGALVPGPEDVYEAIQDGSWQSDGSANYVAIHRIAVDTSIRGQGLAHQMFHDLIIISRERGYTDLRVDT